MKLNIGVIDVPYNYGENPEKTTYEVAQDLEDRYRLFTHFFNMHRDEIIAEIGSEIAHSIINQIEHGVESNANFDLEETKLLFNKFLEDQELDGKVEGVPTLASRLGVNSRLKKKRGNPRPSFIDGGLLKSTFHAWVQK